MVLVDTSVWIDHLRRGDPLLRRLLDEAQVLAHPFVIGELACGNLKDRARILSLLRQLPSAPTATHEEALRSIDAWNLHAKGLSWIDIHLLASTALAKARLWTRDKRLDEISEVRGLKPGME
jgi:predicted nucleic acid-binding protein